MVPKRADDAQLELNMNLFSSSQQIRGGTDPEGAPSAEQYKKFALQDQIVGAMMTSMN